MTPALPEPDDPFVLLTEMNAAKILCMSVRTLQAWRTRGTGPAFVRVGGAVRYRRADLVAWINANVVQPKPLAGTPKSEGAR
jgi:hypothetical protein